MSAATLSLPELQALVGRELAPSPWLEVSQERILAFARATEDLQWIHTDPERARGSPFGGTVAHGFLTLSLLSRLAEQVAAVPGAGLSLNYGFERVRFTAPVPAGSRVRGRFTVARVEPLEGGAQVTWSVTVEREGSEKPCLVAEWLTRHYR